MGTDFIDEIMGFDPQNLDVFNEPVSSNQNVNIYKTNPKMSKSEDGKYRSTVRVIYNPFDVKRSIVSQATYAMTDFNGFFMVKSMLADGNKDCPLFKSWKKLWFSNDENKKNWAKKMYDKSESQWVLVQIMEDENQPEMVGQFKVMKLPKVVFEKMSAKMKPAPESKKTPVPIMDYLFGLPLEMEVAPGPDDPKNPERKQREISYSTCDFGSDYMPIMKTDGTPLFSESELETIDIYATAKAEYNKAKTDAKKAEKLKIMQDNADALKQLYKIALDYVKENAIDLVKECAYQPWDEATTKRVNEWIEIVANMQDPKSISYESFKSSPNPMVAPVAAPTDVTAAPDPVAIPNPGADVMGADDKDDLPF